ncbi:transglycosylase domain-containing protein [Amycolatopsis sp. CA-230715]|uniref:transglycosylase domain-containing protein n=1 Tax=Amycolatopsis sp. CA-230715 TaxID=2745196 RepID=UPI001C037F9B|nr:transglycosylase domain-containing protein [Amycolatopsis sp. CA-230715]QWF81356.1 Penicillin-binding protein 1A [Amycolatopsis sp. CA-230715]
MRKTDGLLKLLGLCVLAGVLVAGVLFPVVGAAGVVSNRASETVDNMSAELANVPPPLVTTVTDSAGAPIATLYKQYRLPAAPEQISLAMKWALVSVEDKRFYEHHGVDWKGTMRAAISNGTGGDTQGASTLTQQYVKNYLINVVCRPKSDEKEDQAEARLCREKAQEQSIARKLKEARIAIQLETKMTKDQVLAGYLNVVEFSRQVFGIGAAAKTYFNTTPDKLNVSQSALLAGLVNNPNTNDPWNHPLAAKKRRDTVLDRMVDNKKLAPEDAVKAKNEPLGVVPELQKPPANCTGAGPENGFFCQYVEDYLLKNGMTKDDLYTGGYTIKTTMDERANHEAKASAETQVNKTQPNVANTLSLVKPGQDRHEVVALAANRDYGGDKDKGQTTYALPSGIWNVSGAGSSYKIFTAAAAMQNHVLGIYSTMETPSFHISGVFTGGGQHCPTVTRGTRAYCLSNASDSYGSQMSLQQALATSPNTGFVILEEKTGMGPIVDMASKLGMRDTMASSISGGKGDPNSNDPSKMTQTKYFGPTPNGPGQGSFTLGVSPTSGLELANVAATILSHGKWCPPTPIGSVTDRDGKPKQVKESACEQVVEPALADTLAVGMSKDDQPGGTSAKAAGAAGWNRPIIGKTGTTQVSGSATFVGGTPGLAGAAMVFRPDSPNGGIYDGGPGNISAAKGTNGNMFGGGTPARTWFGAMKNILGDQPIEQLPGSSPQYERVGR